MFTSRSNNPQEAAALGNSANSQQRQKRQQIKTSFSLIVYFPSRSYSKMFFVLFFLAFAHHPIASLACRSQTALINIFFVCLVPIIFSSSMRLPHTTGAFFN